MAKNKIPLVWVSDIRNICKIFRYQYGGNNQIADAILEYCDHEEKEFNKRLKAKAKVF